MNFLFKVFFLVWIFSKKLQPPLFVTKLSDQSRFCWNWKLFVWQISIIWTECLHMITESRFAQSLFRNIGHSIWNAIVGQTCFFSGRHHHVRSLRNFKANSTEVEIPNNGIALQYNAAGDAKYQNGSKEYQVQPRTFDIIFSAIAGLFAPTTTRIPPCVLYPCRPPMPPPCGSYPCGPPMRPPVIAPAPPPPVPVPMPPRYPCCAQCLQPCYRPYPYYPPIIIGGTYPPFFTTTAASFFGFGATTPNYNNIYVFPNGGPYYPFGYYRARNGRIWHSGNSSEVQHFSDSQKKNSER